MEFGFKEWIFFILSGLFFFVLIIPNEFSNQNDAGKFQQLNLEEIEKISISSFNLSLKLDVQKEGKETGLYYDKNLDLKTSGKEIQLNGINSQAIILTNTRKKLTALNISSANLIVSGSANIAQINISAANVDFKNLLMIEVDKLTISAASATGDIYINDTFSGNLIIELNSSYSELKIHITKSNLDKVKFVGKEPIIILD
ncbi:MAG: hypothetical protein ACK4R7_02240 [Fervidobacterium sp.]